MTALMLPEPLAARVAADTQGPDDVARRATLEGTAGSFPRSPLDLELSFHLGRGLIAKLEITA